MLEQDTPQLRCRQALLLPRLMVAKEDPPTAVVDKRQSRHAIEHINPNGDVIVKRSCQRPRPLPIEGLHAEGAVTHIAREPGRPIRPWPESTSFSGRLV